MTPTHSASYTAKKHPSKKEQAARNKPLSGGGPFFRACRNIASLPQQQNKLATAQQHNTLGACVQQDKDASRLAVPPNVSPKAAAVAPPHEEVQELHAAQRAAGNNLSRHTGKNMP